MRNHDSRAAAGTEEEEVSLSPIALLEEIRQRGRVWEDLCQQYGVTNPDPPWKTSLEGMCDALAAGSCAAPSVLEKAWLRGSLTRDDIAQQAALPLLERRAEEDELSETLYQDVPFPERQLLALAHSLIKRGLMKEEDLARRIAEVTRRLNSA
jgi:hypothetical protein